jgi:hypothetical protein
MAKKQGKRDTVVELHVPKELFDEAMKLKPETVRSTLRAVFGEADYGMTEVVLVEKSKVTLDDSAKKGRYRKTCGS